MDFQSQNMLHNTYLPHHLIHQNGQDLNVVEISFFSQRRGNTLMIESSLIFSGKVGAVKVKNRNRTGLENRKYSNQGVGHLC